jgi:hypothetical protein
LKETKHKNCDLHRKDHTCLQQSMYPFDEGGVVYSETQNRFAGLDASGVLAYCAFEEGQDIQKFRECYERHESSSPFGDMLEAIQDLSRGIFPAEEAREEWPRLGYPLYANIEIGGIPVFVEYPAGPLGNLCRDYFLNCPATTSLAQCHLYARPEDDGWAVCANGQALLSQLRDEQLGLGFLHAARALLYAKAEYDVAFHAAMVADNDRGLLLCAPRESGKSTLSASLMVRGFELLTDEPALLHLDSGSVSSLPFPVSLKEGSWTELGKEWPQLSESPIHIRSDGVRLRLLHPPQTRFSTWPRCLTHFVFPKYNPTHPAHMEKLSPLQTLGLLNEGGLILATHMDMGKFEAFLKLVCRVPAFAIQYASPEEAFQMVRQISAENLLT